MLLSGGGKPRNELMSEPRALTKIRTPREWLGQVAARYKRSQRSIATELQRDASQVNKWFSGKEPIPHPMFLAAAAAIDSRLGAQAASIWIAHDVANSVASDARRQLLDVSPAVADAAAATLLSRAEISALEFGSDTDPECHEHLSRYVLDAYALLCLVGACQSRRKPFISRDNIQDHLRFPFNVMAGDLMAKGYTRQGNEALRQRLRSSMRSTALADGSELRGIYCRQHAYHMLARYGDPSDGEFACDLMSRSTDLHTRRTARYAEIINISDPRAAERFMYELTHDRRFAQVTLEFDFIHYGDRTLGGIAKNNVTETVRNYLRRTRQRSAPSELCLHKLQCILLEFGSEVFEIPSILARVRALIGRIYEIEPQLRTFAEKRFIATFDPLAGGDRSKWKQLELTGLKPADPQ